MSRGSEGDEQRVHPRVPVSGSATIRVLGETSSQSGKLVNLSRSGVLVATESLALGARVRVDAMGLQATGTVVRHASEGDATGAIAIRFDELQDPDWSRLRRRASDW